jgi:hypothetical protein
MSAVKTVLAIERELRLSVKRVLIKVLTASNKAWSMFALLYNPYVI